jgi:formylglycine-generating enzyme required for sulfatase activity
MIRNKNNSIKKDLSMFFLAVLMITVTPQKGVAATIVPEKMALINAGGFTRGINKTGKEAFADEAPAKNIYLSSYYIDKFEVSNAEYTEFIKATDHPAPAYWDHHQLNQPSQPVTGVNWFDANTYCHWANKRLPSEAEWEKAARGPAGLIYPWGNNLDYSKANFSKGKTGQNNITVSVDAHPEGKSYYGVYNMAGNVFEWVQDWYDSDYYKTGKEIRNPKGPQNKIFFGFAKTSENPASTLTKKVIRGGSWFAPAQSITTTHRFWNDPINNSYGVGLGFRCARDFKDNPKMQARSFYMDALTQVGNEKLKKAKSLIEQAIKVDPEIQEYKSLLKSIEKQM